MTVLFKQPLALGILLGIGMATAYLVPYAGFFVPFFIAVFLYVFRSGVWQIREVLLAGFAAITVYEFLILSWAWGASFYLSSSLIHVPFLFALLLIFFTLSAISLVAGAMFLPWVYVSWRYRFPVLIEAFVLSGGWVLCEWLRIGALSLLSYGDGVLNPPYLSFGMIGYTLADYPKIVSLASFGGIYMLSFVLAIVGVGLFYAHRVWKEGRGRRFVVALFSLIFVVSGGLVAWHSATLPTMRSVPITLTTKYSFPQVPTYTKSIKVAQQQDALVVLPEGSRQFYEPFAPQNFKSLHRGSVVIDSYPAPKQAQQGKKTPGAFAVTSSAMNLVREKHALAPYGEFTPLAMTLFAHLTGFSGVLDQFTRERHYTPGSYDGSFSYSGVRGSVIFCDEIAVPNIAKEIVEKTGSQLMIAIASTHWFPSGYMLHRETIRMAKVRAVEAGVPIARSAYGDPAFVVDASGNLLYEGPWAASAVATVQVPVPVE